MMSAPAGCFHRFDRLTFSSESAFFAAALESNSRGLFQDRESSKLQSRPFATIESIPEKAILRNGEVRLSAELRSAADHLRFAVSHSGQALACNRSRLAQHSDPIGASV
jgi:hypothetical protein